MSCAFNLQTIEIKKSERERRKEEALERSRARQQDPSYFNSKIIANKIQPVNEKDAGGGEVEIDEEDEEENSSSNDPFRHCNTKQRNKVFVR